ncbi:chaperone protein HscA homolog [Saccostrea cucullata]|uniref:chaperone protein HscA homolog n=1 Tax=Saccostrea cuccullata TaxID=36930 RepID=UPI002ED43B5B
MKEEEEKNCQVHSTEIEKACNVKRSVDCDTMKEEEEKNCQVHSTQNRTAGHINESFLTNHANISGLEEGRVELVQSDSARSVKRSVDCDTMKEADKNCHVNSTENQRASSVRNRFHFEELRETSGDNNVDFISKRTDSPDEYHTHAQCASVRKKLPAYGTTHLNQTASKFKETDQQEKSRDHEESGSHHDQEELIPEEEIPCEEDETCQQLASRNEHDSVVSIDIGTTVMKAAVSLKKDESILMTIKEQCASLYTEDGQLMSIGAGAEKDYRVIASIPQKNKWTLLRNFKPLLIDREKRPEQTEEGTYISPAVIYKEVLKKITEKASELVKKYACKFPFYVITCPAYYTREKRIFLADIALQAGVNIHDVTVVTETEAVMHFSALNQKIASNSGLILDIGGGSTNITIFNTAKKEMKTTEALGGQKIDEQFSKFMQEIFRDFEEFCSRYPTECLDIQHQFEDIKSNISGKGKPNAESEELCITLPANLHSFLFEKTRENLSEALQKGKFSGLIRIERNKLYIITDLLHRVFEPTLVDIIEKICKLTKGSDISNVCICGGLTKVPYIRDYLESFFRVKFEGIIPYFPEEPELAVAKGANFFGQKYHARPLLPEELNCSHSSVKNEMVYLENDGTKITVITFSDNQPDER